MVPEEKEDALVQVAGLTRLYHAGEENEVRALDGVSFTIHAGDYVALMGPSGSGKSTLMNQLGCLDTPTSGTYRLAGEDVSGFSAAAAAAVRNQRIGFVFQRFNLLPRTSALENVELPLRYGDAGDSRAAARASLEAVGLAARLGHHPNQLSGGQSQRVAIARALVTDPDLLLADEPTGNLDTRTGAEIMRLFRDLNRRGVTLVLVTHSREVAEHADRILHLRDGELVRDERRASDGSWRAAGDASAPAVPAPAVDPAPTADPAPAVDLAPAADPAPAVRRPPRPPRRRGPARFVRVLVMAVFFAVRNLRVNKLRSFLTVLGMVIGVASVITMVGVGHGAQRRVMAEFQAMGTDLLMVFPGSRKRGAIRRVHGKVLELDDAVAIRERCPNVGAVSPERVKTFQVKYFEQNLSAQVVGTWPTFPYVRSIELAEGRYFTEDEGRLGLRVCVLGSEVATTLFGEAPAVGETVRVQGAPYRVLGVNKPKGRAAFASLDDQVFVPLETFFRRLLPGPHLRMISLRAASPAAVPAAMREVQALMDERHPPPPGQGSKVVVFDFREVLDRAQTAVGMFAFLIAAGAAISLMVGGIGIMNIMLVSVTERTREIGLRKALGATRADIVVQFLGEAVVVGCVGGLLGLAVGWGVVAALEALAGLNSQVPAWAVAAAVAVAGGTGVVFGVYPAWRAGGLDPIEALRWE